MEKTNLGTVIPLDSGWSDIGNWNSVWKVSKKDKDYNYSRGNVFLKESKIVMWKVKINLYMV